MPHTKFLAVISSSATSLLNEVNPSMLVRAEAKRYRINGAVGNRGDINMFSVSLVIPFGRTPALPPAR